MPSLLDFSPMLGRRYGDRSGELIGAAFDTAGNVISKSIESKKQEGIRQEKEFSSIMDLDINKTNNRAVREYLAGRYNQFRNKGVSMYMDDKDWWGRGNLSVEQRLDIEDMKSSIIGEAETLNSINTMIDEAKKSTSSKDGGINVVVMDDDLINKYHELLKPKKDGSYDIEGMKDFVTNLESRSETGVPFTKYNKIDTNLYINEMAEVVAEDKKQNAGKVQTITDSNGKIVSTTTSKSTYGTPEEFKSALYGSITKGKMGAAVEANLDRTMSEEDKATAELLYGDKVPNPLTFYDIAKKDVNPYVKPTFVKDVSVKPKSTTSGRSSKTTTIEPTARGWKYGTNKVMYDGDLEIDGEMQTVVGARNTGIVKKDDGLYAEFIVPRDPDKEMAKLDDKVDKEVNERVEKEVSGLGKKKQKAAIRKEVEKKYNYDKVFDDESKKKTVLVPIESVYDELIDKFEDSNVFIKGLEEAYRNYKPKSKPVEEDLKQEPVKKKKAY